MTSNSPYWWLIGLVGQFLFSARFLLQWLASERQGQSTIPESFWHISILGSLVLLAYAIHIQDPIFIMGQLFGLLVYFRNLALLKTKA